MTRAPALLGLLALAGCGGGAPPPSPALAACRSQAVNDPAVVAATLSANSPLQDERVRGVHDQAVAMQRAVQHCLAAKGLAPKGGVEPVQGDWLGPPLL